MSNSDPLFPDFSEDMYRRANRPRVWLDADNSREPREIVRATQVDEQGGRVHQLLKPMSAYNSMDEFLRDHPQFVVRATPAHRFSLWRLLIGAIIALLTLAYTLLIGVYALVVFVVSIPIWAARWVGRLWNSRDGVGY